MDDFQIPENLDRAMADLVVTGKEFAVGLKRFKVKRVYRGSMSDLDSEVIPIVREREPGLWVLGLYRDPELAPHAPLVVAFELERLA